jgi:excisionase family DNA binding protein
MLRQLNVLSLGVLAKGVRLMSIETTEKLLLSAAETAALLGISRSAFYSLLSSGRIGPLPVRLGRRTLWRAEELRAWTQAGCPARDRWLQLQGVEG